MLVRHLLEGSVGCGCGCRRPHVAWLLHFAAQGMWRSCSRRAACAMRTGRGKISTERASGSSRGAVMPRWIASSSSLRRRTWETRTSVAGWMTPLTTLAFLMLGTPLTHVGRQGGDPTVAPRRHCWTVVRSTTACPAFCSRL